MGLFIMILLFGLAFNLITIGNIIPGWHDAAEILSKLLLAAGGFIAGWSLTIEGNTFISNKFGAQNLGVDVLAEPGQRATFRQVKMTDDDFIANDLPYRIINEMVIIRRGLGIPYLIHKSRVAEPLYLWDMAKPEKSIDAADNASYINRKMALIVSKAVRTRFDLLQKILIGGFILTIVGMAIIYLKSDEIAGLVRSATATIVSAIPHPAPSTGALPSA